MSDSNNAHSVAQSYIEFQAQELAQLGEMDTDEARALQATQEQRLNAYRNFINTCCISLVNTLEQENRECVVPASPLLDYKARIMAGGEMVNIFGNRGVSLSAWTSQDEHSVRFNLRN